MSIQIDRIFSWKSFKAIGLWPRPSVYFFFRNFTTDRTVLEINALSTLQAFRLTSINPPPVGFGCFEFDLNYTYTTSMFMRDYLDIRSKTLSVAKYATIDRLCLGTFCCKIPIHGSVRYFSRLTYVPMFPSQLFFNKTTCRN